MNYKSNFKNILYIAPEGVPRSKFFLNFNLCNITFQVDISTINATVSSRL